MNYFGKAEQTANAIIKAFEDGRVPGALGTLYIEDAAEKHSAKYSWLNRFVVAIHGYSDAMGMKQWNKKDRRVIKGEKAFYILAPCMRNIQDKTTGEKRLICIGFKAVMVFGQEQTEGKAIEHGEETRKFFKELPLRDVAEKWGLELSAYNGTEEGAAGSYAPGKRISLGVKNLSTWAHELAHAADDRNGSLPKIRRNVNDHALSEVVAELAGAVLLECIGRPVDADLGGAWSYIKFWAEQAEIKPIDACRKVITRVTDAVNLILEEAGIRSEEKVA